MQVSHVLVLSLYSIVISVPDPLGHIKLLQEPYQQPDYRELVKSKKLHAAWSQQGNILVQKSENSQITQINDNCDLMDIKLNEMEHDARDQNSDVLSGRDTSVLSHLSNYEYFCDSD